jgi:hypothetical protein
MYGEAQVGDQRRVTREVGVGLGEGEGAEGRVGAIGRIARSADLDNGESRVLVALPWRP